jgi:hypothetical protein
VDPVSVDEIFRVGELAMAVTSVDECAVDAVSGHQVCLDFLTPELAEQFKGAAESKSALAKAFGRMTESGRLLQNLIEKARSCVEARIKGVAAKDFQDKRRQMFDEYDKDGDGCWNREEFIAYAKEQCNLDIPRDMVEIIFKTPGFDDNLVDFDCLHFAESAIGIARDMVSIAAKRQEEEIKRVEATIELEKRKAMIEPEREVLKERLLKAAELGEQAELAFLEAEKVHKPLIKPTDAQKMETDAIRSLIDDAEMSLADAKAKQTEASDAIEACAAQEVFPELKSFMESTVRRLRTSTNGLGNRMKQLTTAMHMSLGLASKRDSQMFGKVMSQIGGPLRAHVLEEKLTKEALWEKVADADADGLSEEQWLSLLELCNCKEAMKPEELSHFFRVCNQGGEKLPKEAIFKLLTPIYKVVKDTVVTTEFGADDPSSKLVRKLLVGEFLEALDVPAFEESVGVPRFRCKVFKDSIEGWVSLSSNAGTRYLEEAPAKLNVDTYKVVKAVSMTAGLNSDKAVRELDEGCVLEKLQFPRRNVESALRIRAKAKDDKSVGWVTVSAEEEVFLELSSL